MKVWVCTVVQLDDSVPRSRVVRVFRTKESAFTWLKSRLFIVANKDDVDVNTHEMEVE